MKAQHRLAIALAKTASRLSRLAGKQGQNLPGTIGLRLAPGILRDLARQVKGPTVMVCGTNGKTTVNNLLADLAEQNGYQVIANRSGANQRDGIAGSFILASRGGKISADLAFLESDEAWSRHTIEDLEVDLMIITNLFRDQLDRYGEIDTTMNYLLEAIAKQPDIRLLVNGDDALCVALAKKSGRPFATFGVASQVVESPADETREATYCPMCDHKLTYHFYHFSQLGDYTCTCGFQRPELDYRVDDVTLGHSLQFRLNGQAFDVPYRGFYNVYNLAAVIAACDLLGLKADVAEQLKQFTPRAGRNEVFQVGRSQVILNLAKNPAGFNQNIQSLLHDDSLAAVLIGINDQEPDGRDISWLWDVYFDRLGDTAATQLIATGSRAHDLALRLKYDGLEYRLVPELTKAIDQLLADQPATAYVLVNYTLLLTAHDYLSRLAGRSA